MKRKIIQLAGKTLVVSLPVKWAREHGIKKGDEVDVSLEGNKLLISPEGVPAKIKITLYADDLLARRQVNVAYKRGYDEIELFFSDPKTMRAVEEELAELIGFEIIHRSGKSAVIRNISSPNEEEFENVLRRVFLVLLEMHNEALKKIKEGKNSELIDLVDLEKLVDRLTNFCKRIINKKKLEDSSQLYALCCGLEELSDEYAFFFKETAKLKSLSEQILNVFEKVGNTLRLIYQLYYSGKPAQAQDLIRDLEFLKKDKDRLYLNKNFACVSHLLTLIKILEETSWLCIAKTL